MMVFVADDTYLVGEGRDHAALEWFAVAFEIKIAALRRVVFRVCHRTRSAANYNPARWR